MELVTGLNQALPPIQDDDEFLSPADAAIKMDMNPNSLSVYIARGRIPSIKTTDGQRLIKMSVCEETREARAKYGNQWAQHVSWDFPDKPAVKTERKRKISEPVAPAETEVETEAEAEEDSGIYISAGNIHARATDLLKQGKHEASAEMFNILCEQFNF